MKASELRELDRRELSERLSEAKEELFNLRFQLATNQLDNTARLREVRREIARILTVLGQAGTESDEEAAGSARRGRKAR